MSAETIRKALEDHVQFSASQPNTYTFNPHAWAAAVHPVAVRDLLNERDTFIALLNKQCDVVDRLIVAMNANADLGEKAEAELARLKELVHQEPISTVLTAWKTGALTSDAAMAKLFEHYSSNPVAQPAQEQVDLYGVKAGVQVPLGKAPMPPSMKARQLAREQFGHFEDDDGSDAELCFGALEQMIEWMYSRGFRIATLAQPAQEDAECDHGECFGGKCIYKQPAQTLTDDEIESVYLNYLASKGSQPMWSFARAVIDAHIKKNGGQP